MPRGLIKRLRLEKSLNVAPLKAEAYIADTIVNVAMYDRLQHISTGTITCKFCDQFSAFHRIRSDEL
jgi:hypothetical protein